MTHAQHRMLIGADADPRITIKAEDGTEKTIIRFERLADMILGYYREERFEHVGGKPFSVLTGQGDTLLRDVLPREFGPNTVEFIHLQVRKRLVQAGKMRGEVGYVSIHLPTKFEKLSYQTVVDTLLWYAEYANDEERELIMEFLLTDGRFGSGWKEYNEKNRRVQAILTQVGNSQVTQKFPKE